MNADVRPKEEYQIEFLADDVMFDPLSLCTEALFTQSDLYYRWQLSAGKVAKHFLVKDGSRNVAYAQCFFTPVRFLGGRGYWYAPYGPVCAVGADRARIIKAVSKAFSVLVSEPATRSAFFRFDFYPAIPQQIVSPTFRFLMDGSLQPRSEWLLALQKDEAGLLEGMHPKARYSIQHAQRKGVSIQIISEKYSDHLETFCALMQQTAQRDGFTPHADAYYQALFSELDRSKQGFLVIGSYVGEPVSVALMLGYGKTATYVFGASSDAHRNVSAPALVQWAAILEAKRCGYAEYSFGGVSSERFPVKTWDGITMFKRRFGGHEQDHSLIVDAVFQPIWYGVFVARKWAKRYLHI
ncbi:MAG: peptidoglycan bridge formation glycyltransferase FemA/FemB family protein [bacterium]